jgi:hypothetical protein
MLPALLLFTAGSLFADLPRLSLGGPVVEALLPMALAIAFAIAASGRVNATAISAGALGAFAGSVAWTVLPALGGALIVALAYAERTFRVRTLRAKGLHVGLGLVAGAAAGALSASYAASPAAYRIVATVMCAVLAALPLCLDADDPRVLLLESAAAKLGPPVSFTLLDGVELLRCGDIELLDRETAANVKKSWRSLDKLIEARLRMHDGTARRGETAAMVTAMVDRQITEHIASLTRAYAAVTTIGAAATGLDDSALRDVHARGEALDEQSRAMVEVGRG